MGNRILGNCTKNASQSYLFHVYPGDLVCLDHLEGYLCITKGNCLTWYSDLWSASNQGEQCDPSTPRLVASHKLLLKNRIKIVKYKLGKIVQSPVRSLYSIFVCLILHTGEASTKVWKLPEKCIFSKGQKGGRYSVMI